MIWYILKENYDFIYLYLLMLFIVVEFCFVLNFWGKKITASSSTINNPNRRNKLIINVPMDCK